MATPIQLRALRALRVRLQQISIENGYLTNTGERIFAGRREIQRDQCPAACVVYGGNSLTQENGRSMALDHVVYVDHFVERYEDDELADEAISEQSTDIRKAALANNRALFDGDGESDKICLLRYVGSTPIEEGVSHEVEAQRVEFRIPMEEAYGDPTRRT